MVSQPRDGGLQHFEGSQLVLNAFWPVNGDALIKGTNNPVADSNVEGVYIAIGSKK
jgi:hypothetical protein